MQTSKGFWSTIAAVTALVCCCLGICYGMRMPKHHFGGHKDQAKLYLLDHDMEDVHYYNGNR